MEMAISRYPKHAHQHARLRISVEMRVREAEAGLCGRETRPREALSCARDAAQQPPLP